MDTVQVAEPSSKSDEGVITNMSVQVGGKHLLPLTNKLPRILLINAYDMKKVSEMYSRGTFPGHHLFGAHELAEDYGMNILIQQHEKYTFLNWLGKWFDVALLDQQIRALVTLREGDIVYAPFAATNTKLILMAKWFGFIDNPIVILVHQPLFGLPSKNRLIRFLASKLIPNFNTIIFFSQKLKEEVMSWYNPPEEKRYFHFSPLGVDLEFFKNHKAQENAIPYVISSGNTGRDFDILIKAAQRVNCLFKIYCKPESFPKSAQVPENVEILSGEFPFRQICEDIASARLVLIPLTANPQGTIGLISLLEALALGKPIIMTKNKYIDVDFEKENIGVTVEENDIDGWAHAIASLIDDDKRLKVMGDNSLRLAKSSLNINIFAKELALAIEDTYRRYNSGKSRQS